MDHYTIISRYRTNHDGTPHRYCVGTQQPQKLWQGEQLLTARVVAAGNRSVRTVCTACGANLGKERAKKLHS